MSRFSMAPYRSVLAIPRVRSTLWVGSLVRLPYFATAILITVHSVSHLHQSYAVAGALGGACTLAGAIASPWRGRLLDRYGLRRVVGPSAAYALLVWLVAPWVGFTLFAVLVVSSMFLLVPVFAVVRQILTAATSDRDRRTVMSLDSMIVELSLIAYPPLVLALAKVFGTPVVVCANGVLMALSGVALWLNNPDLRADSPSTEAPPPLRSWVSPAFVSVLAVSFGSAIVLSGTDLALVAASGTLHAPLPILVLLWGVGSLVGGLVYGAYHQAFPSPLLLGFLAFLTIPLGLVAGWPLLGGATVVAGLACAPTVAAQFDEAARFSPEGSRGQALGWQVSAVAIGGSVGAPLAGWVSDHLDPSTAFLAVACAGAGCAIVGALLSRAHRDRATDPVPDRSAVGVG